MAAILLIDDINTERAAIAQTLTEAGHDIIQANNGTDGLEIARQQACSLVILPIFMSEPDGVEVIRQLRSEGCKAPIVAISGSEVGSALDLLPAAMAFGASAGIERPIDSAELLRIVAEALENSS